MIETTIKRIISAKLDWSGPEDAFMLIQAEGTCAHPISMVVDAYNTDTEVMVGNSVECKACTNAARAKSRRRIVKA